MHEAILLYLSSTLPIVAVCSVLILLITNLFIVIRKKLPVKVNCWFCNAWLRVPYQKKNSFDCTNCLQYNGFDLNGDYNKIIQEQYVNVSSTGTKNGMKSYTEDYGNGLCKICNNNQQLKVYQLANFVPLNERNYDIEIEHFQKQLDKAYKLCKKCEDVLTNTLDNQNRWLFHMKLLSENKFLKKITDTKILKENTVYRMLLLFLIVILLLHVVYEIISHVYDVNQYLSSYFWPYVSQMNKNLRKTKKIIYKSFNATMNRTDTILESLKTEYSIVEDVFEIFYTNLIMLGNHAITEIKLNLLPIVSLKYSTFIVFTTITFFFHILLLLKKFSCNYKVIIAWLSLILSYFVDNPDIYVKIVQAFTILIITHNLVYLTRGAKTDKKKLKIRKNKSTKSDQSELNINTANNISSPKPFAFRPYNNFENSFSSSASVSLSNSPLTNTRSDYVFGTTMLNRSKSPSSFSEVSSVSKYYSINPSTNLNKIIDCNNSQLNNSLYGNKTLFTDLNGSFVKLNIGGNVQKNGNVKNHVNKLIINKNIDRPRPVLSPARLNFIETYDKNTMLPLTNLSRSSSQSSGFISQTTNSDSSNYQTLPNSCIPSMLNGDIDSVSLLSEPINQLIDREAQDKQMCNNFYPLPCSQILLRPYRDNYSDCYSSGRSNINDTTSSLFKNNLHFT